MTASPELVLIVPAICGPMSVAGRDGPNVAPSHRDEEGRMPSAGRGGETRAGRSTRDRQRRSAVIDPGRHRGYGNP